ncbi:MAG TPA: TolC family protein [Longimicrobiales bacterium]|nr:TolC family protein [Longimicrobiales bacterium]
MIRSTLRGRGRPLGPTLLTGAARSAVALAVAALLLPRPAAGQALTLAGAADAALATHPSVLAAGARVDGADAARRAARAAFLPSVMGTSGLTRYAEPMVVAPLHGFDPMHPPDFDRTLVQSQLGMEWTLLDFGARRAQVRGAQAVEEGLGLRRNATVQELLEAVAGAYTGVLAARDLREAALRQTESLASELDRAQQRLREGTAARVEVLRAEAALLDARAQLATAEARTGLAERNLARLMGADPTLVAGRELADVAPREGAGTPDVGREQAAGAPITDPRVEAARRSVQAARARLSQERAGRLPTLKGSAGLLSFGSGAGEYVTEWQAGLRVSWPLFTGGARSAAIARAEADLRVAEEELRQAELGVAASLDGADAALAEATARARALQASVAQWEEVARIETLSLETGAGVQQDFLRAEAALFQARAGYARARYDEILAFVGRARAQGTLDRGWMDARLETR